MASDGSEKLPHDPATGASTGSGRRRAAAKPAPEWADGLKQLYDAVVEEELPDQLLDLLAQLDEQEMPPQGRGGSSPSGQGNAP
ncbi:MAG: NepR family anti-sigma factor [Erythrobacter sp.]